jgi:DNA-binding transcriptional ArsR family regulator
MISTATAKDIEVEAVLSALADPTRRRIVEMLGEGRRTASEIHRAFPIANPAVSRHLRVLREAGLIVEHAVPGDARVRLYGLEPRSLEALSAWIEDRKRGWQDQLESFKDYVSVRSQGARSRK